MATVARAMWHMPWPQAILWPTSLAPATVMTPDQPADSSSGMPPGRNAKKPLERRWYAAGASLRHCWSAAPAPHKCGSSAALRCPSHRSDNDGRPRGRMAGVGGRWRARAGGERALLDPQPLGATATPLWRKMPQAPQSTPAATPARRRKSSNPGTTGPAEGERRRRAVAVAGEPRCRVARMEAVAVGSGGRALFL